MDDVHGVVGVVGVGGVWGVLAYGPAGAGVRAAKSIFDALQPADCTTLFASPAVRCNRVCTISCCLNLLPSKGSAEFD